MGTVESADVWSKQNNMNAVPKAVPGISVLHSSGKDLSECHSACEADSKCTIYTFNHNSKHCFWSFDGKWDPIANDHTISGCLEASTGSKPAVKGCPQPGAPTPAPVPTPAPQPSKFDGKLFNETDGTVGAYMIPPYVSNHASTIEQLPDGTLAAAWFSGLKEEASGCAIVFATLPSGSDQWSKAVTLSERDGYSNQNPVLWYDLENKVLKLYHSQAKAKSGESASVILGLHSTDMGKTWTKPTPVFTFPGAFPRNRIIPSLDGGALFPIYNAGEDKSKGFSGNFAIIERSDPTRQNWTEVDIKDSVDCVQPTCVRLADQSVRCWFRDRRATSIYVATSSDDGKTWTKPVPSVLPNPNVGIEAFMLKSGNIVMVFNNYSKATQGKFGRTPLNIGLSKDNGNTWHIKDLQVHDDDEAKPTGSREYSYPSVLQTKKDAFIHITYTYDRATIKYRRLSEDWIMSP
jgi:predicted neuraminidase